MVDTAPPWSDGSSAVTLGAGETETYSVVSFKGSKIEGIFKIEPVTSGDPVEATLTWQFSEDGTTYVDVGTEEVFNENAAYEVERKTRGYKFWKATVENTGSNSFKLYASVVVR